MPPDHIPTTALDFTLQVERSYAALILFARGFEDQGDEQRAEPGLGGKLLYAGELDQHGRALLVAGNVAGAASLAATADQAAQKQAIRDGVADFLVTSLDEALRILKNEIRKRETVAVCIGAAPETIEREMLQRGVLPDFVGGTAASGVAAFGEGVRRIELEDAPSGDVLVAWTVAAAPAQWLPKLDAIALDCLDEADEAWRRWIRLAPRYLGRMAQGVRVIRCESDVARVFVSRVKAAVGRGEIGVEVRICRTSDEETLFFQPSPGLAR